MADPYAVLGVTDDAPDEVIKAAHRALVLKHHPDRGGDGQDVERLIEINKAFELVGDPRQRAIYEGRKKLLLAQDALSDLAAAAKAAGIVPRAVPAPAAVSTKPSAKKIDPVNFLGALVLLGIGTYLFSLAVQLVPQLFKP